MECFDQIKVNINCFTVTFLECCLLLQKFKIFKVFSEEIILVVSSCLAEGLRWVRSLFFPTKCPLLLRRSLKVQSCKLYNDKYMIASTQITNNEIFASADF